MRDTLLDQLPHALGKLELVGAQRALDLLRLAAGEAAQELADEERVAAGVRMKALRVHERVAVAQMRLDHRRDARLVQAGEPSAGKLSLGHEVCQRLLERR